MTQFQAPLLDFSVFIFQAFCLYKGELGNVPDFSCPYTEGLRLMKHTAQFFPTPAETGASSSTFSILFSWKKNYLVMLNLWCPLPLNTQTCFSSSSCSYLYFFTILADTRLCGLYSFMSLYLVPAYTGFLSLVQIILHVFLLLLLQPSFF